MKNPEFAGNSLEPKLPQCKNVSDWTISRDSVLTKECLLAWLAGLWDGEGWIGINLNKDKSRSAPFRHRPAMQIQLTDEEIFNRILDILDGLGIKYYSRVITPRQRMKRIQFNVHIVNRKNVLAFISAVYPYAVRLKPLADIVLEYMEYYEKTRSKGGVPDPQEKFDAVVVYYERLKSVRNMYDTKLPETTKGHPVRKQDDGIVRLLAKANG
jgi:intein/homing endonuclease